MSHFFRQTCLPWITYFFYLILSKSWRITLYEPPELKKDLKDKAPLVMAHWHGDELALVHLVQKYKIATMTSTSKDGQLIDFVIKKLGGQSSKGSSSRGAVSALKGLIRLIKKGHPCSIAVDGPKGPIYKAKPGVFEISRLAKARIYPVAATADRAYCFPKSWNQTFLPKFFAKVYIHYLPPLAVINKDQNSRDPLLAQSLEEKIAEAKEITEKHFASH